MSASSFRSRSAARLPEASTRHVSFVCSDVGAALARLFVVGPVPVVGHVAAYFRLGEVGVPAGTRSVVCIVVVNRGSAGSSCVLVLELDVLLRFRHGVRVVAV
jgi:hypothetical protein